MEPPPPHLVSDVWIKAAQILGLGFRTVNTQDLREQAVLIFTCYWQRSWGIDRVSEHLTVTMWRSPAGTWLSLFLKNNCCPCPMLEQIDESRKQMSTFPMEQGGACPFPETEKEDSVSPLRPLRDVLWHKVILIVGITLNQTSSSNNIIKFPVWEIKTYQEWKGLWNIEITMKGDLCSQIVRRVEQASYQLYHRA